MDSRDRRALTLCAICGVRPSTKTGEHVLPKNLLRDLFPAAKGPYTTTTPTGITTQLHFDAIKLACCERCNSRLNQRFEDRRALPARRPLVEDEPTLNPLESRTAALWFLKTWLLLAHPRAEYRHATPVPASWSGVPESVWSWAVQDRDPPPGLSVWAFRHQPEGADDRSQPVPLLHLPHVVADEVDQQFRVIDLTLQEVNVAVVWHPGWPIDHPATNAGRVRQLWPLEAGAKIDRLPVLAQRPVRWMTHSVLHFRPGTYDETLPPLTTDTIPFLQVQDRLQQGRA